MDRELFDLKPGDKLYSHKYELWLTIFSISPCIDMLFHFWTIVEYRKSIINELL